MNPNAAPTVDKAEEEKVEADEWFLEAKREIRSQNNEKSLIYSYDFNLDKPMKNKNQRYT